MVDYHDIDYKDFCMKVRFRANKNGLDINDYTNEKIIAREEQALASGMTHEQFVINLLDEVCGREPRFKQDSWGLSKCPGCGQMTLIHEDGCEHCKSCGYSKCG